MRQHESDKKKLDKEAKEIYPERAAAANPS